MLGERVTLRTVDLGFEWVGYGHPFIFWMPPPQLIVIQGRLEPSTTYPREGTASVLSVEPVLAWFLSTLCV